MSVIDFHSHFFSRPFFEALADASPLPGDREAKLGALAANTGIELPPADVRLHLARWIAELDRHGVEHLVTFASLPEEVAAVGEAAALSGGRITPIALVNPRAPGAAERTRALLATGGFKGVLVFPALHHFHLGGAEARPLLEVLAEHGAVVYAHCGILVVKLRDLLGLPRPYDLAYANPLGIIPAANAFPRVRFVVPHFGAGFFRETLIAGAQCDNVFVDTSSSNSWMKTQPSPLRLVDVFERALGVFGTNRILFGTDSNVFPAGWRRDRLDEQVEALEVLGMPGVARERILAGNARTLLGLPGPHDPAAGRTGVRGP